jgi:small subunit ribosomal protein S4
MARNLDSVCKMCRREGIKLYLKGARCESPKCAMDQNRRKNVAPGMHGYRRGKLSEYGVRLREKQKLKRFYGVLENQFRRYFQLASRSPENTGEVLLSIMERRLDNIIHRLGFAPSRRAARQMVGHNHILVNGKPCNIPSILLHAGDTIAVRNRPPRPRKEGKRGQKSGRGALMLVKLNLQESHPPIPDFLEITSNDPPEGRITRLPTRSDVDPRLSSDRPLEEQLIIEVCSR